MCPRPCCVWAGSQTGPNIDDERQVITVREPRFRPADGDGGGMEEGLGEEHVVQHPGSLVAAVEVERGRGFLAVIFVLVVMPCALVPEGGEAVDEGCVGEGAMLAIEGGVAVEIAGNDPARAIEVVVVVVDSFVDQAHVASCGREHAAQTARMWRSPAWIGVNHGRSGCQEGSTR